MYILLGKQLNAKLHNVIYEHVLFTLTKDKETAKHKCGILAVLQPEAIIHEKKQIFYVDFNLIYFFFSPTEHATNLVTYIYIVISKKACWIKMSSETYFRNI